MPAVWHRRLLESPCIVSGSISKQIKERKGGDAVSASSTPNDAELRREIGPFENSIYSGMSPCLTDYIPIPVRSNAVHLTRPRRRKCSTMLPLHRLRFSPCGRNKCIRTDATRVFSSLLGVELGKHPHQRHVLAQEAAQSVVMKPLPWGDGSTRYPALLTYF